MVHDRPDNSALLDEGAMALVSDYLGVKRGESVLITMDTDTDASGAQAIFRAAYRIGAMPCAIAFPRLPFQGALADPYVPSPLSQATKSCDVWVDLAFPYLAGAHVHEEAMAAKRVRYLLGGDIGGGGISRLFGSVDLARLFGVIEKFEDFVLGATGKEVTIRDPIGTNVTFRLDKLTYMKRRRADKPGSYVVPGSCTMYPVLDSVCGTICLTSVFHEYYAMLPEPLVITVNGKIQKVDGPAVHRVVLDRALRRAGKGEYGNIIHFTYGISPAARMTGASFIEDMRAVGNNAVGMGLPWWLPGGGENHPDGVLSNQSIWIDKQEIVRDGVVVGPADIAELARALIPSHTPRSRDPDAGVPARVLPQTRPAA